MTGYMLTHPHRGVLTPSGAWTLDVDRGRIYSMRSLAEQARDAVGLVGIEVEPAAIVRADPEEDVAEDYDCWGGDSGLIDCHEG